MTTKKFKMKKFLIALTGICLILSSSMINVFAAEVQMPTPKKNFSK